jgi:putative GTP pyrophosphokinase
MTEDDEKILALFDEARPDLETHVDGVRGYLTRCKNFSLGSRNIIHSIKHRIKDKSHLIEKMDRKRKEGRTITSTNFFDEVTDLAGVRLLHLFQSDFEVIDTAIRARVNDGYWVLKETPKAYSWDPETVTYLGGFELEVASKPSMYTSVHYLIQPQKGSRICCELQVRTVFEEIWGEVDHLINYPEKSSSVATQEQIKVLSKIVGAGSRMLEAIQKSLPAKK